MGGGGSERGYDLHEGVRVWGFDARCLWGGTNAR